MNTHFLCAALALDHLKGSDVWPTLNLNKAKKSKWRFSICFVGSPRHTATLFKLRFKFLLKPTNALCWFELISKSAISKYFITALDFQLFFPFCREKKTEGKTRRRQNERILKEP